MIFFWPFSISIRSGRGAYPELFPKHETDHFFDLDEKFLSRILIFSQPIARAIEKSFHCDRCGISVVGLEVPHAHMHLIPIDQVSDMDFKNQN